MAYESKAVARRRKLRDALIAAAERTIAADGLRGLKARELAYKVGCAVGAIYNVVTDLDDLIFAVNALTLEQLEKTLTIAGRPQTDPKATRSRPSFTSGSPTPTTRRRTRRAGARCSTIACPRGARFPTWYRANLHRLFVYIEDPLRKLAPAMMPARRALLARSMFSAVHGIVLIGLEEKLQSIPLPVLREQVTVMVEALARGLTQDGSS